MYIPCIYFHVKLVNKENPEYILRKTLDKMAMNYLTVAKIRMIS